MWRDRLAPLLEHGNGDLPFHAGEVLEKPVEGVSVFKVVEKTLDRHPSAAEDGDTALHLRVDRDEGVAHGAEIIRRPPSAVANPAMRRAGDGSSRQGCRPRPGEFVRGLTPGAKPCFATVMKAARVPGVEFAPRGDRVDSFAGAMATSLRGDRLPARQAGRTEAEVAPLMDRPKPECGRFDRREHPW